VIVTDLTISVFKDHAKGLVHDGMDAVKANVKFGALATSLVNNVVARKVTAAGVHPASAGVHQAWDRDINVHIKQTEGNEAETWSVLALKL
jgi:hypothetical protein